MMHRSNVTTMNHPTLPLESWDPFGPTHALMSDLIEGILGPDTHAHHIPRNESFDGLCGGCEYRCDLSITAEYELDWYASADGIVDLELLVTDYADELGHVMAHQMVNTPPIEDPQF